MNWVVNEVPEQFFLNTKTWRFLIPKLYKKYPNENMTLNISVTSSPSVMIGVGNIGANVNSDLIINVLDDSKTVPVACISVVSAFFVCLCVHYMCDCVWENSGTFQCSLEMQYQHTAGILCIPIGYIF